MKKIVTVFFLLTMLMVVGSAHAEVRVPEEYVGTWRNIADETHTWLIEAGGHVELEKDGERKLFTYIKLFNEAITDFEAYYYPSINAQGQLVMRPDPGLQEDACIFERYEVVLPAGCELCQNGIFVCKHEAGDYCWNCGNTKGGYCYTCTICNGKGYKVCSNCGGDGMVGQVTCWACKYGRNDCYSCDNTGVLTSQYRCSSCGESLVCHICYDVCHGVKDIACYQCSGSGATAFEYNKVMRAPDDSIGKAFTFSGQIISVENLTSSVSTCVLRDASGAIQHDYQVQYIRTEGSVRVLVGDVVNVTGYFISYDRNNKPIFMTNQLTLAE